MLLLAATCYFYYELVMFWILFSHQFHLKQPRLPKQGGEGDV